MTNGNAENPGLGAGCAPLDLMSLADGKASPALLRITILRPGGVLVIPGQF